MQILNCSNTTLKFGLSMQNYMYNRLSYLHCNVVKVHSLQFRRENLTSKKNVYLSVNFGNFVTARAAKSITSSKCLYYLYWCSKSRTDCSPYQKKKWSNVVLLQVTLFQINCDFFYTNSHDLFCQFINWTNWVNSSKFMDNCWISCQVMADTENFYDDLIIINLQHSLHIYFQTSHYLWYR